MAQGHHQHGVGGYAQPSGPRAAVGQRIGAVQVLLVGEVDGIQSEPAEHQGAGQDLARTETAKALAITLDRGRPRIAGWCVLG
ncbi:MAG TPA: hypothetical protein VFU98_08850, partial [Microlunatus sp.]|nr:hypothetical protein [Microlunatus sp.]